MTGDDDPDDAPDLARAGGGRGHRAGERQRIEQRRRLRIQRKASELAPLRRDHRRAALPAGRQDQQGVGHNVRVGRVDQEASLANREGDRPGGDRDDRDAVRHRLGERDAEALVPAHGRVDVGARIPPMQRGVVDGARQLHLPDEIVTGDAPPDLGLVGFAAAIDAADQDQTGRPHGKATAEGGIGVDEFGLAFAADDPAHEQDRERIGVQAVDFCRPRGGEQRLGVEQRLTGDGERVARAPEFERVEGAVGDGGGNERAPEIELLASEFAHLAQERIGKQEGRGDVVIGEHLGRRKCRDSGRFGIAERVMHDQHVVGVAGQVVDRSHLIGERRVMVMDVNLAVEAEPAQQVARQDHAVGDGVTRGHRRVELVHRPERRPRGRLRLRLRGLHEHGGAGPALLLWRFAGWRARPEPFEIGAQFGGQKGARAPGQRTKHGTNEPPDRAKQCDRDPPPQAGRRPARRRWRGRQCGRLRRRDRLRRACGLERAAQPSGLCLRGILPAQRVVARLLRAGDFGALCAALALGTGLPAPRLLDIGGQGGPHLLDFGGQGGPHLLEFGRQPGELFAPFLVGGQDVIVEMVGWQPE